jgi:hypothetical protein
MGVLKWWQIIDTKKTVFVIYLGENPDQQNLTTLIRGSNGRPHEFYNIYQENHHKHE